jgi:hypothetical protein
MDYARKLPDLSSKTRWTPNNRIKNKAQAEEDKRSNKRLKAFYDSEFRKWHYKLALIIILIITCLYIFIYTTSSLLNQG